MPEAQHQSAGSRGETLQLEQRPHRGAECLRSVGPQATVLAGHRTALRAVGEGESLADQPGGGCSGDQVGSPLDAQAVGLLELLLKPARIERSRNRREQIHHDLRLEFAYRRDQGPTVEGVGGDRLGAGVLGRRPVHQRDHLVADLVEERSQLTPDGAAGARD